jgi:hypothetical protein
MIHLRRKNNVMLIRALLSASLVLPVQIVSAQDEHVHGENGLPTWYAPDCCNVRDCHPVEDSTIEFGTDALGKPIVIHKPTPDAEPIVYYKDRYRQSQDERYHVCYYKPDRTPYCVYLRGGA